MTAITSTISFIVVSVAQPVLEQIIEADNWARQKVRQLSNGDER